MTVSNILLIYAIVYPLICHETTSLKPAAPERFLIVRVSTSLVDQLYDPMRLTSILAVRYKLHAFVG